jgi:cytochrome bd-type quinol oxidase subunit 2
MSIVALALLAAMLVTYALLDGYDLGVGAVVHLFSRPRRSAVPLSRASARFGMETKSG